MKTRRKGCWVCVESSVLLLLLLLSLLVACISLLIDSTANQRMHGRQHWRKEQNSNVVRLLLSPTFLTLFPGTLCCSLCVHVVIYACRETANSRPFPPHSASGRTACTRHQLERKPSLCTFFADWQRWTQTKRAPTTKTSCTRCESTADWDPYTGMIYDVIIGS